MNNGYDWNTIFRQLYTQLLWQSEKLIKIENQLEDVLAELDAIRKQKPVNVEKIEYNFDQLKVEKLDGTLNIGITPDNAKSIEQFAIGDNDVEVGPIPIQTGAPESYAAVQSNVNQFLQNEAPYEIKGMESQFGLALPNEYRDHIVTDVSKQINARIAHYIQEYGVEDRAEHRSDHIEAITERVKADIRQGIEQFLRSLPPQEDETG
ncbi:spore germination protein GerPC [Paenibacillus koleovorans]|uniref:spore germination protein GerPC n=1 Tax=Paenibacillus koleovorans TaxID=121608 RepID=UPI000FDA4D55|nr:spore germination protein GerPC [Paenibacillus koleovorans]